MTWLLPAVLLVIALAAGRYGVDSRDGQDWQTPRSRHFADTAHRRPRTPTRDLAAALAVTARLGRGVATRIARAYRAQAGLWERHLLAQQPWRTEPLRWTRGRDGWQLTGRVLPPTPRTPPAGPDRPALWCD